MTSKARVNTETHSATIAYEIDAGPPCTFGSLKVATGDIPIKKAIVERALTFKPENPMKRARWNRVSETFITLMYSNPLRSETKTGSRETLRSP